MRTSFLALASLGLLGSLCSKVDAQSTTNSSSSGKNASDYLATGEKNLQTLSCYIYGDLSFYDLIGLQNNVSDYNISSLLYTYNFNFCKYATSPCGDETKAYAYRYKNAYSFYDRCIALTDDEYTPDYIKSYDGTSTNSTQHLLFTLGGGE